MPKTTKGGESPEWKKEDFRTARRIGDLPESLQQKLRKRGERGAQKVPTKELVSIRLSPDVLENLRGTGAGWQSRVDEILRAWVIKHPAAGAIRPSRSAGS